MAIKRRENKRIKWNVFNVNVAEVNLNIELCHLKNYINIYNIMKFNYNLVIYLFRKNTMLKIKDN